MTMISTEKINFLKKLSKGIHETMEINNRAIRIGLEPMNEIERYISDEYIERMSCCLNYYLWFSYEIFSADLDTMEEKDEKRLREILFYFDYTDMTIAEIYKNSFIKIEELDDEKEAQYAKDIENKVITSFEQFLKV